jgi:predicted DNA-binding transcriptional regulator AlpA
VSCDPNPSVPADETPAPARSDTRPDPIAVSLTEGPLLIPDTAAAGLSGVSRAHWQRLRTAGKVPPSIKLGRKVLWRKAEVIGWIQAGCPDGRTWAAMQAAAARRMGRIVG